MVFQSVRAGGLWLSCQLFEVWQLALNTAPFVIASREPLKDED